MSNIKVTGNASGTGTLTIAAPNTNSDYTLTLPAATGTILQSGTTVTVAQGGTGATTLTANNVILGNGTSAVQFVAPGTAGNVLTSNGTTWASTAPGGGFAAGTVMLFGQTAAPTGWTKDATNYNNSALRVVTGTASTGGTVDFTTAFASQAVAGTVGTSGATTLATTDIPSHNHAQTVGSNQAAYAGAGGSNPNYSNPGQGAGSRMVTDSTGGGGSHTHSGGTFTGTAINLAVKYVDVIRATKD